VLIALLQRRSGAEIGVGVELRPLGLLVLLLERRFGALAFCLLHEAQRDRLLRVQVVMSWYEIYEVVKVC
jgi:hypothetical protein